MRYSWLWKWMTPAVLALSACGGLSTELEAEQNEALAEDEASLAVDNDADGISDTVERRLALKFAPQVRLSAGETALPSSVDWYLERVRMAFNHPRCLDHPVLERGKVTQALLVAQTHPESNLLCGHTSDEVESDTSQTHFFLQHGESVGKRETPQGPRRAYARVRKSLQEPDGYDIQYWFFYPYNDAFASINHEADWEHITVVVDGSSRMVSAYFGQHNGGTWFAPEALTFVDQTHPVVYSARGTHASYPASGRWKTQTPVEDICDEGGEIWPTQLELYNIGERDKPLRRQLWLNYGGRWGQIGLTETTSGPQGPAFQDAWDSF